jgi:hypothetical protein
MALAQAAVGLVALVGWGSVTGLEPWVPLPPAASAAAPAHMGLHPRAAVALKRMLELAEEKLANPICREVFGEFQDTAGRPLDRVLESAGRDAAGLLRGLEFVDGSGSLACGDRRTLAWTNPGARTIRLCSLEFADAAHSHPQFAANLLIHESLHSLGLGENPPSSSEITERVGRKCGR